VFTDLTMLYSPKIFLQGKFDIALIISMAKMIQPTSIGRAYYFLSLSPPPPKKKNLYEVNGIQTILTIHLTNIDIFWNNEQD